MAHAFRGSASRDRQARIAVYVASFAIFLAGSIAFTLTSWNKAMQRHDRELESVVAVGARAMDTYFGTLEKSLAELGDKLKAAGLGPDTTRILASYKRRYPEFSIVTVTTLDGEIILTSEGSRKPDAPIPSVGREPSFVDAQDRLAKGARMVVSRTLFGPVSRIWLTPLRYGVRDAEGKLQFIISAGLSQERTQEFWKDAPLPPGAAIGLLRDDFYLVARHPLGARGGTDVFTEPIRGLIPDFLNNQPSAAAGVARGRSGVIGADATVAFRFLPNYPLIFFARNPQSQLRAEWWSLVWPTYLLILLLFGGGLAITRWIERRQSALQEEREARVAELEALAGRLAASNAELKQLSNQQRLSNTALENSNAELEAFMYSVSHDLKAPLRAIDGYSAILAGELAAADDSEVGNLIRRIRDNARRMSSLLNDLLDLSRYSSQELKKEDLDTRREVESVIDELGPEKTRARFEIGALPMCRGDRILMHQVWSNLLSNALKYSAKTAHPVIRIGYERGAYFVADNGSGFDMAYVHKLFKLFSRLNNDPDYAGTGVGLAIVKRIVERHGGHIGAEGAVGSGATFSFVLPA